jgi:excisionase family DNA binding protein
MSTIQPEPPTMYTPSEVASILRVSVATVLRAARAGVIPAMRVGRGWRFEMTAPDLAKRTGFPSRREMEKAASNSHRCDVARCRCIGKDGPR